MRYILQLILFTIPALSIAQKDFKNQPTDIFSPFLEKSANGNIEIVQDKSISDLLNSYSDFRKKDGKIPGYRIRIFSNSGQTARAKANEERERFIKTYPEIPTYLEYDGTNFKVYVGDYRNKIEAFQAFKKISREFKNAFMGPSSKINLPKI